MFGRYPWEAHFFFLMFLKIETEEEWILRWGNMGEWLGGMEGEQTAVS